jgi:hypothetical protein
MLLAASYARDVLVRAGCMRGVSSHFRSSLGALQNMCLGPSRSKLRSLRCLSRQSYHVSPGAPAAASHHLLVCPPGQTHAHTPPQLLLLHACTPPQQHPAAGTRMHAHTTSKHITWSTHIGSHRLQMGQTYIQGKAVGRLGCSYSSYVLVVSDGGHCRSWCGPRPHVALAPHPRQPRRSDCSQCAVTLAAFLQEGSPAKLLQWWALPRR